MIGDRYYQRDSATLGEDACQTASRPQSLCSQNPSGALATRYLLNGNTMDDYLNVIDPPFRWTVAVGRITDNGGVHLNSAIWNNALWTIRSQLAKIDNQPGYQSKLAGDFDLIVYYTLTHQLGPNSSMVDAANAVEDTAVKAGADADDHPGRQGGLRPERAVPRLLRPRARSPATSSATSRSPRSARSSRARTSPGSTRSAAPAPRR